MPTKTESRVSELQGVIEAKSARAEEILQSDAVKIDGQNVNIPPALLSEVKGMHAEVADINLLIGATKFGMSEKEFKGTFGSIPGGMSAAMAAAAGESVAIRAEVKTLGEGFVESEVFQTFKKTGRLTMDEAYSLDLQDVPSMGTFDQKDVFNGSLAGSLNPNGFGRVQFDPAIPRPQRTTRVRDLFPVATTNANLIDYFRVLGFAENNGEGNARTVADREAANGGVATGGPTDNFGLKAKSNLVFQSAQAPVRTIAHWEAAHRNVLADEPQLQSTINNELLYGLALEEDYQILNGDGQAENLMGILATPYTQSYTQANNGTVAQEPKSDALRRAATKAIIANYAPTGYVLHPYDWEEVELQKDGDGRYMLVTNISVGAESRVWRQPVVETPAMTQGTFVTGAWGIGAQLYDRQLANVRIAEQHADFFVRNAVAILVEERLAFAVKRPESFVIGTFFQAA